MYVVTHQCYQYIEVSKTPFALINISLHSTRYLAARQYYNVLLNGLQGNGVAFLGMPAGHSNEPTRPFSAVCEFGR